MRTTKHWKYRQDVDTSCSTFLVNGIRCSVSTSDDSIDWWPTGGPRKRRQIKFVSIIGLKHLKLYQGKSQAITKTNAATSAQSETTTEKELEASNALADNHGYLCEKIKLYYAKHNEHKSTEQLLKLRKITVAPVSSDKVEEFASFCRRVENELELHRKPRPKRLLVFVNPYGGKGRALNIYKRRVDRLFKIAQVESTLIVTNYANHARDTIEDPLFNIEYFDGVVCIGGDGMFSELMNGLLFRYNRDKLMMAVFNPNEQLLMSLRSSLGGIGKQFLSPPVPIGVIGAGSTDANSFGLIGTNDVMTATLNILLGKQIQVDVCSIHSVEDDRLLRFVSTFVAYGYFGDVIRESERLRWLGPSRYDVTGFNTLMKNRAYPGVVRILVSSEDGTPNSPGDRCHNNCQICQAKRVQRHAQQAGAISGADDVDIDRNGQVHELDGNVQVEGHQEEEVYEGSEFKIIEQSGPFVGVNAAVTACRCPQTRKGFSPSNHLGNGCADLILVRPCSRFQYLQYLLRTGYTRKSAFDLNYVDAYRCRQFEFVAPINGSIGQNSNCQSTIEVNSVASSGAKLSSLSSTTSSAVSSASEGTNSHTTSSDYGKRTKVDQLNASSWNVDGEILDEQSIRVKVNNQLLRVFGTGEPE